MKKILLLLIYVCSTQVIAQSFFVNPGFESEYVAVLTAATNAGVRPPSDDQKIIDNKFLLALKTAGLLTKTDFFRVYMTDADAGFTEYNWANSAAFKATRNAAMMFRTNGGVKGNTVDAYVDENWQSINGINGTQNATEAIFFYKDIEGSTSQIDGANTNGVVGSTYNPGRVNVNETTSLINSTASATITDSQFDKNNGLYFFGRLNSTTIFHKKDNGTRVTSGTVNSSGRSIYNSLTGSQNVSGVPSTFSGRSVLMRWEGALLTTTEEAAFKAAWDTFYAAKIALGTPRVLGSIYSKTSWTSGDLAADFTNVGATVSVVSGKLHFSGGASTFTQTLQLNKYTALDKWVMTTIIRCATKDASSGGWAIGLKNATGYDVSVRFIANTGGASGQTQIFTGASEVYTSAKVSPAIAFSAQDQIQMMIERNGNILTVTTTNLTTPDHRTITYDFPGISPIHPNTGKWAIYSAGGVFDVDYLDVYSHEIKNTKYLAVGASNASFYAASKYDLCWPAVLGATLKTYIPRLAGGGDRSNNMLARVQEIIDLAPKTIIMTGVSNDIIGGVASATYIANYEAMCTAINIGLPGARIIHTTGLYIGGLDQSVFRNYIIANKPVADVIVTDNIPLTLAGDNTHPLDAGYSQFAQILVNSGKLAVIKFSPQLVRILKAFDKSRKPISKIENSKYSTIKINKIL